MGKIFFNIKNMWGERINEEQYDTDSIDENEEFNSLYGKKYLTTKCIILLEE